MPFIIVTPETREAQRGGGGHARSATNAEHQHVRPGASGRLGGSRNYWEKRGDGQGLPMKAERSGYGSRDADVRRCFTCGSFFLLSNNKHTELTLILISIKYAHSFVLTQRFGLNY